MTLNYIYRKYLQELQKIYSAAEASTITNMIIEYFTGLQKSDVIKDPDRVLDEALADKLKNALDELLQHKPVQYITGEVWFYKMKLKVSSAVLIPRPETEELVTIAFTLPGLRDVLDIGTGSGCIPIAIKKNKTDSNITAIDVSNDALLIAGANAKEQNMQLKLIEMNFLDERRWNELACYDLIISNPPYIPESHKPDMDRNVTENEPHLALFVDSNDPILFYKKIAFFGKTHLNDNGKILVEVHEDYAEKVAAYFREEGYEAVVKEDMFGKQRFVISHRLK